MPLSGTVHPAGYNRHVLPLLRSLRPTQWVKNSFVLAPLAFGQKLGDPAATGHALLALAAFCAASSAVYLANDIRDRERDGRHPLKRQRPIASGALAVSTAAAAATGLAVLGLAGGLLLNPRFVAVLAGYLGLNLLYTFWLKQVVIVDVMVVSLGFVLRVLGGSEAIAIPASNWLLLATIFVSLFLAFSKRRHELMLLNDDAAGQRGVLSHYSVQFLDQMINVVTASTVLAYTLYAIDSETVAKFGTQGLVYTIPLVLFGVFRYLYLIYQRPENRNPTEAILSDPPFLANLLLWGAAVIWIVYG